MAIELTCMVCYSVVQRKVRFQTIIEKNYPGCGNWSSRICSHGNKLSLQQFLYLRKTVQIEMYYFIDASNEFAKGKNQNNSMMKILVKIIETYLNREDVDKYAHVASLEEIQRK